MGKAYHLRCGKCGWEETFYLGFGRNDGETQAREALEQLLESGCGAQYHAFIQSQERAGLRIERCLYRCRHCGRLQVRLQAQLRGAEMTISPAYYCGDCGRLLGKVKPHMIKKQLCPACRETVSVEAVDEWDIAPPADARMKL